MKELLECKDLLKHKRVVAASDALRVMLTKVIPRPGVQCDSVIVRKSLADVAFAMRDRFCPEDERWRWEYFLEKVYIHRVYGEEIGHCNTDEMLRHTSSEDWIKAATLAWEATQDVTTKTP